jgi:hypothetical protein
VSLLLHTKRKKGRLYRASHGRGLVVDVHNAVCQPFTKGFVDHTIMSLLCSGDRRASLHLRCLHPACQVYFPEISHVANSSAFAACARKGGCVWWVLQTLAPVCGWCAASLTLMCVCAASKGKRKALVECPTCYTECEQEMCSAMDCGHVFCNDCWSQHLSTQINDGKGLQPRCMAFRWGAAVDWRWDWEEREIAGGKGRRAVCLLKSSAGHVALMDTRWAAVCVSRQYQTRRCMCTINTR